MTRTLVTGLTRSREPSFLAAVFAVALWLVGALVIDATAICLCALSEPVDASARVSTCQRALGARDTSAGPARRFRGWRWRARLGPGRTDGPPLLGQTDGVAVVSAIKVTDALGENGHGKIPASGSEHVTASARQPQGTSRPVWTRSTCLRRSGKTKNVPDYLGPREGCHPRWQEVAKWRPTQVRWNLIPRNPRPDSDRCPADLDGLELAGKRIG
jgi:hypothetical protein